MRAGDHFLLQGTWKALDQYLTDPTATISQFISNPSAALVMMPIGLATASELGVSALPMMMGVAMGASASFLTPFREWRQHDGVRAGRIPLRRFLAARPRRHGLGPNRHTGCRSALLEILVATDPFAAVERRVPGAGRAAPARLINAVA